MLFKGGKADCTHILTRHQEEASYDWGKLAQKTLVSPLWLWESYEADEQLALQDPVRSPSPPSDRASKRVQEIMLQLETCSTHDMRHVVWLMGWNGLLWLRLHLVVVCADVPSISCQGYTRRIRSVCHALLYTLPAVTLLASCRTFQGMTHKLCKRSVPLQDSK